MQLSDKIDILKNFHNERLKFYNPVDMKMLFRSEGRIPGGKIPQDLRDFYKITNGASVLDYCMVGCKNTKLLDIAKNTLEIWDSKDELSCKFIGFITTSSAQNFGYLLEYEYKNSFPVAYVDSLEEERIIVISSTVEMFLNAFFDEVQETISVSPESLYIQRENWPVDLMYWFERDKDLLNLYKGGKFEKLYKNDIELKTYINECISEFES